jgi:hypothetical protein
VAVCWGFSLEHRFRVWFMGVVLLCVGQFRFGLVQWFRGRKCVGLGFDLSSLQL